MDYVDEHGNEYTAYTVWGMSRPHAPWGGDGPIECEDDGTLVIPRRDGDPIRLTPIDGEET